MKVLVACEESQVVCSAFRDLGVEAYSCDIQPCSGAHPEWHFQQDVLPLLDLHWDLIIAHPPCTFMSKAGARWMFPKGQLSPERYKLSQDAKAFFMRFYECSCHHVCIENPIPLNVVGLPTATQLIQPYQFGHPYSKATLLWLKNLPLLQSTQLLREFKPYCPSNCSAYSHGKGGSNGVAYNAKSRSKTFKGVAVAMAEQWTKFYYNLPKQLR